MTKDFFWTRLQDWQEILDADLHWINTDFESGGKNNYYGE